MNGKINQYNTIGTKVGTYTQIEKLISIVLQEQKQVLYIARARASLWKKTIYSKSWS